MALATIWYAQAQVRWFTLDLKIGPMKATGAFISAFLCATAAADILAITIGLEPKKLSP